MNRNFILIAFFLCLLILSACRSSDPDEEPKPKKDKDPDPVEEYSLGWFGDDDASTVPVTTNFGFASSGNLPSSVDLTDKLPPIGDQGQYGTCVAWAVGYNVKSAVEAIDRGLNSGQLQSSSNQMSPKDLFIAIPDAEKGSDCNGTNFTNALDVLQNRGVATQATVPYTSLDGCNNSQQQGNWTTDAANHKIKYYRKIDQTVSAIKTQLSSNNPVILGAKLSDNFMQWRSSEVMSSNTTYDQTGIHSYHAVAIIGYDDSKGPNGAFRVVNSWGANWGDIGSIWLGYNFLVNEFCFGQNLYIVANEQGDGTNPPNNDPVTSTGVDLAPWVFEDYSNYWNSGYATERIIDMNIYNIGSEAATPADNWAVYYIYYDAYNADNYGVLFYDEFNQSVAAGTFECPTADNCIVNATIPAGTNMGEALWGEASVTRSYYTPANLTGEYYLVMIADALSVFQEADEVNNFFYTTEYPKYFENGYSERRGPNAKQGIKIQDFSFKNSVEFSARNNAASFNTAVNETYRNAYTTAEIQGLLKAKKQSGELQQKIDAFRQANPTAKGKYIVK